MLIKEKGLTLIEIATVIAIIAFLAALSIPAAKLFQDLNSSSASPLVINSLLASARNKAMQHSRYAGIRFQRSYDGKQYALLIINEPRITCEDDRTIPFVVLPDYAPVSLGQNTGIATKDIIQSKIIDSNNTRVSIIFSSQGRLVRKQIMVFPNPSLQDDEFYGSSGLLKKDNIAYLSNIAFVAYDVRSYQELHGKDEFFDALKPVYINSYTGRMISQR